MKKLCYSKPRGDDRVHQALDAIAHFGHLTVRQLARFIWYDIAEHQAKKYAYSLVHRMLRDKLILERTRIDGASAVVLSRDGANKVNAQCGTSWVTPGYYLVRGGFPLLSAMKHDAVVAECQGLMLEGCELFGVAALRAASTHPVISRTLEESYAKQLDALARDENGKWLPVVFLPNRSESTLAHFDKVAAGVGPSALPRTLRRFEDYTGSRVRIVVPPESPKLHAFYSARFKANIMKRPLLL
jgi:hypothetical protein